MGGATDGGGGKWGNQKCNYLKNYVKKPHYSFVNTMKGTTKNRLSRYNASTKIQDGSSQIGNTYISACIQYSFTISKVRYTHVFKVEKFNETILHHM